MRRAGEASREEGSLFTVEGLKLMHIGAGKELGFGDGSSLQASEHPSYELLRAIFFLYTDSLACPLHTVDSKIQATTAVANLIFLRF